MSKFGCGPPNCPTFSGKRDKEEGLPGRGKMSRIPRKVGHRARSGSHESQIWPTQNFDFQIKTRVFASRESDKSEIGSRGSKSVIFGDVLVWLALSGRGGSGEMSGRKLRFSGKNKGFRIPRVGQI